MEILSQNVQANGTPVLLTALVVILTILALYVIIDIDGGSIAIGVVICMCALIIGCIHNFVPNNETTYYKATITDFNEVYERGYEVVDNEGKIYTLKKKEDE